MNYDMPKAHRLIADAEEKRESVRHKQQSVVEGRQDAALFAGRIYSRRPHLAGVTLADMARWSTADRERMGVSIADVRAAIEARDRADDMGRRYAAAAAAAAPAIKLGARVREFLQQKGIHA